MPRQRGAALLIFSIIIVMAALAYLVSSFAPDLSEARRERKSQEALAQARDALIGYALRYRDDQVAKDLNSDGDDDRAMYGYLPLPDLGSSRNNNIDPKCHLVPGDLSSPELEGCDANTFTGITFDGNGIVPSVVGRFPWRTLGVEPLRDGHGECLWLIVSSLHSRIQRSVPPPVLPPMNWDTLGQLDIFVANGSAALASTLASAHDRPVAIIFSPGPPLPGQNRGDLGGNDVTQCGGNYDAKNYLDPTTATALIDVTNYLAGANNASGTTGDSDPSNDPDTPKKLTTQGKVFASGGNFLPNACANCTLHANDSGLPLTGNMLFGAIRKHAHFRTDINSMLDRMTNCLRDKFVAGGFVPATIAGFTPPTDKSAGRIPYDACYDSTKAPLGYYDHYQEMLFVAKPNSGNFTVNDDTNCAGVLIFAGQRGAGQQRVTSMPPPGDKGTISNYLEANNLSNFTSVTALPPAIFGSVGGPILLYQSPPQAAEQDIARCIPAGGSFTPVTSPTLTPAQQLVAYDAATRILTLGKAGVISPTLDADALFGCAWFSESRLLGSGIRTYFGMQFINVGGSVGNNGFVFTVADAITNAPNNLMRCGAGGSHLGYSGNNGVTPKILFPKLGIEFDQSRDSGIIEPLSSDLSVSNPGRNDPDCTVTYGYNSHAAIVYWGHDTTPNGDGVTRLDDDDNVHDYPTAPSLAGAPRPPRGHLDPATETGIKCVKFRGHPLAINNSKFYYVRVEATPTRNLNVDPALSSTSLRTEVWMESDILLTNRIDAIKNTTRPMGQLYPAYAATPTLSDTAILYDVPNGDCTVTGCPACKTATNTCYWPALNKVQLGFTGSQRTQEQQVEISDFFTTWLP